MPRHKKNVYLESLGCARNLVDSELMLGRLAAAGWNILKDPTGANAIIINTCSFIESAISESIDTILELAKHKENGRCRRIIVTGCLPERFREKIVKTLPEVDFFLGTGAYDKIMQAVEGIPMVSGCLLPDPNLISSTGQFVGRIRNSPHMAYIKIAEGCSRHCSYCIIPKLRGKQRSRPVEDIVSEARLLIESGAKELVFVAQDTTSYGKDLGGRVNLGLLLEKISRIAGNAWIRVLYGHPESIDDETIKVISSAGNICSYFDIPVQHSSRTVLKKMGRNYSQSYLLQLFDRIRSMVPDASLRTTVMSGFPGETEKDTKELLSFIEKVRFDHLGAFVYSDSKDIPSHKLPDRVPKNIAKKRYDRIMSRQMEISVENNRKYIGKILDVLIEESPEENLFIGRTIDQAPEVDGITYVTGNLKIGSFARAKITDALEYDLVGEAA
ncbi:MAG: 30S ribosomal protein S12 methylthiotransferase RimO [Desulfobacteraceae bacterium]|nr:MAG: 30S ribosomal protein S12 methylthiotransferase RimO [Desulfobacteraceae bacterium]